MKEIRRKRFREYLLLLEISALTVISAILFASIWLVLEKSNNTYLNLRLADADKVHLFLESQLIEARKKLEIFASIPEKECSPSLQDMFTDFSDIYLLDSELRIDRIYKSVKKSKVFKGFSFSGGKLGAYLKSSIREKIFSDIMRGNEDDSPSIYYTHNYMGNLYLVRMNLDYVRQILVQFSRFSGTPFMFVSKDGFIMLSSNPELNIYSLDLKKWEGTPSSDKTLTAGNYRWIPIISAAGNTGAKVAILIPAVFPEILKKSFMIFYISFISILIMLIFLKNRMYNHFILQPLDRFSQTMERVRKGSFSLSDTYEDYRIHEFITIYDRFRSMAQAISQREESLKQSKELADRLAEKAEAANNAKSVFLSNMSHELRTPLNSILGFTRIMAKSPRNHKEEEYFGIIQRSGEHLLTLINQVLDLSKIEAGRITLNEKNFDLKCLLDDLKDMFSLKAEEKGIELIFEYADNLPCKIITDEVKLRQILINLLNNAIKFTEKGYVILRAGFVVPSLDGKKFVVPPSGGTLIISFEIEDTGAGISSDEADSVFEAFVQTETGRQSQEGTGLGLPISRKFVQLMGGDISVQSEVGKGSIFSFHINAKRAESSDIKEMPKRSKIISASETLRAFRILIADDNSDNRRLMTALLEPLGFDLREAANGEEAVQIWKEWSPHLIFMDLRMPVMDGYAATKALRDIESDFGSLTKIILISASSIEDERKIAISKGCDDFIRKPFREYELFEMLQNYLGVKFIYDEPVKSEVQDSTAQEVRGTFADVPAELLNDLAHATEQLDISLMLTIIGKIRIYNCSVADMLEKMANNFEYEQIMELFRKTR